MSDTEAVHESKTAGRGFPLIVFLICSLLLFESTFFAFISASKWFQIVTFVGFPLFFSALAVLARRVGDSQHIGRHSAHISSPPSHSC